MPLPDTRMGLRAVEPLIVDDSVQSLEMMSALMMGFGVTRSRFYEVMKSLTEAGLVESQPPHVALTDAGRETLNGSGP